MIEQSNERSVLSASGPHCCCGGDWRRKTLRRCPVQSFRAGGMVGRRWGWSRRARPVRLRCRKGVMTHTSILEAKSRHEAELLGLPNVTGVGIGERAGKPVIKVFVTKKVHASQLARDELVPRSLEGHEVDVEAIGFVEAQQT
jgi:hypothetical protein